MGTWWGITFSRAVTNSLGELEKLSLWVSPWRFPQISCCREACQSTQGFHCELYLFIHSFHKEFSSVYHVPGIALGMRGVDLSEACRMTSSSRFPGMRDWLCATWVSWSPYFGRELRMQCNFLYRAQFPRTTCIKVTWKCLLKCIFPGPAPHQWSKTL